MYAMTRSKRMQPVHGVARKREQDAGRQLDQSRRNLEAQQTKLAELRAYREQYAHEFTTSSGHGLDATRLRDYRVFLGRLNEAVRQQEEIVARCHEQLTQDRAQWIASRSHSQAIEKVIDGFRREERRQEDKLEQREQDERAQRRPHR